MSEVLVRENTGTHMMRPVMWVAVTVLAVEAVAGLVGVSVLSYRAITTAGYAGHTGSDVASRTLVIVLLLALVGAAIAMAAAMVRHRVRGGAPSRPLAWAAITVLITHALIIVGCLVRAEWASAVAIAVGAVILGSAWAHCLRRHR